MAVRVSHAMVSFVVAHETSHVLLGHIQAASPRRSLLNSNWESVVSETRQQELDADLSAQRILIGAEDSEPSGVSPAGGIAFLAAYLFIKKLAAKLVDVPFEDSSPRDSHASAQERIALLADYIKQEADAATYERCTVLFDTLWFFVDLLDYAEIVLLRDMENAVVGLLGVLIWPDMSMQPFVLSHSQFGHLITAGAISTVKPSSARRSQREKEARHLSAQVDALMGRFETLLTRTFVKGSEEHQRSSPQKLQAEGLARHLDAQMEAFMERIMTGFMERYEKDQRSSPQKSRGEKEARQLDEQMEVGVKRLDAFLVNKLRERKELYRNR